MTQKDTKSELFKALTWNDLTNWAGISVLSRGKSYQRDQKVIKLYQTNEGILVARVKGSNIYITKVNISEAGTLSSTCTCPYDKTCKHAVAAVIEYLEQIKQGSEIFSIKTDEIQGIQPTTSNQTKIASLNAIHRYLTDQTKEQLIELLEECIEHSPQIYELLIDRVHLANGAINEIVNNMQQDITLLDNRPLWNEDWYRENDKIDISKLQQHLEYLLAQKQTDKVISLGEELLAAGTRRVEMEYEGESGPDIANCMKIVFRALSLSSLSLLEQMLWAIDMELSDEYDLCCEGVKIFWQQEYNQAQWSQLADALIKRIEQPLPQFAKEHFFPKYHRGQLVNWLIQALDKADREVEVIPLCQRQVDQTNDGYVRLVTRLKQAGRITEIEPWIHQGIAVTQKESPGIATQLRDIYQELQQEAQNWPQVAALQADQFFNFPSLQTFKTLLETAQRAGVLAIVRMGCLHYLETGEMPQQAPHIKWLLPEPAISLPTKEHFQSFPDVDTLIQIAIAEKQPKEVLRWYYQRDTQSKSHSRWGSHLDNQVAEALASHYPDKAIEIWKKMAEDLISTATPKAYQQAAPYLQQVRQVLQNKNREQEWHNYIQSLRQTHSRKRRFLEVIDILAKKRILD